MKEQAIMKLQWVLGSITFLSIGYYRCVTANNAQNENVPQTDFCFDGNNEGKFYRNIFWFYNNIIDKYA